ncbi:zinc-binding dehydrogenase [Occultella gossypii]|uniref:Zinc-binding dehydrogenase n=1 Tax=Occultella gossypii TaxID=2800820 RepID=A0ABS7S769_9MICO|nr:zinc-binding dehydrogenase [Occultella gossypii]MBZ2196115.1 zinc-binding dehydrogenase [Occultella gossypii]
MDAIRLHAFGPPENLVLDEVPDPEPGAGEVLIAGRAHGVHLLDTTLRRGEPGPLPLPALPTIPGREVAGSVAAVGPGVDPGWVGRRVAAHLGAVPDGGGYARLVVAPLEVLHPIPDGLSEAAAVAMIGTGRMATIVLDAARLGPDDQVVITAAAGGLGSLFVQAALRAGARVVALVGGRSKADQLAGALADIDTAALTVIDYRADGWLDEARTALGDGGATVAFDGVGGDSGTAAASLLSAGGRLVSYGWASGTATDVPSDALYTVVPIVGPGAKPITDIYERQQRALALAAAGTWRPLLHEVPFADAARAHHDLESRATTGKVVLV